MDKKDQHIIKELDLNPKITTSKLAKKVRLSQQVVNYRIKKLKENQTITHFGTILNLSKLGLEHYRILLNLGKTTPNEKQEILTYLKKHKSVYWSATVGSKWDIFIVLYVKDYEEYEAFLESIFKTFPQMEDYDSIYVSYQEFYRHRYLYDGPQQDPIKIGSTKSPYVLSDFETSILNNIKSNCRVSSLEVSKQHDVSYKTVQARIKNFEEKNLIAGYRLFLDSKQYGYDAYILLISFSNYGRDIEKKIFAYARENPYITQAVKLFGAWSLQLHIRAKDYQDIQKLVVELRNTYPIIGDYEIIPVFEDSSINLFPSTTSP
ncbi:MAG: hypothetical protein CMH61_00275 [Nanoarchaeota archaeon]|nr:hypothetical protein [Nanoarchaeota archaeon]